MSAHGRGAAAGEQRFELLVGSIQDYAIFLLDTCWSRCDLECGRPSHEGYLPEEIIGKHLSIFYPPEDRAGGRPQTVLDRAIAEGRVEDEGWRVRKDGVRFWADVVVTAIFTEGIFRGFIEVTRDLTDRRKTEEERLRLVQAHEAVRLRDEFLSIASHELKTPLAALLLLLGNMQRRIAAIDEHLAKSFDRATRIGARLGQLVDALLDVSRIATGELSLNLEPLDLCDSAREVTDRMRESAAAARCELSLDVSGPVEGRWDRLRIEQVLMNLISNSIKYAAGCPIRVSVAREGPSGAGPGQRRRTRHSRVPASADLRALRTSRVGAALRRDGVRSLCGAPDRGSPRRLHRRDQPGRRRGLLHRELAGRPIEHPGCPTTFKAMSYVAGSARSAASLHFRPCR